VCCALLAFGLMAEVGPIRGRVRPWKVAMTQYLARQRRLSVTSYCKVHTMSKGVISKSQLYGASGDGIVSVV
jgi:hypothetical protein